MVEQHGNDPISGSPAETTFSVLPESDSYNNRFKEEAKEIRSPKENGEKVSNETEFAGEPEVKDEVSAEGVMLDAGDAESGSDSGISNAENAKRRIDKRNRKLQRRIDELEAKIGQFEQIQHQTKLPQAPNEQFATHNPQNVVDPITGEYLSPGTGRYDAVLLRQQEQMLAEHVAARRQQEQEMQFVRQQQEAFQDALDDAADRYEDFDDVVRNDNLPLTETMVNVAMVAPQGADLLYYLAKNPKEVQRISRLHPIMQQQEMAKHAIAYASRSNVSKAPPPVKPLGETASGGGEGSFAKLAQNPQQLRDYLRKKQLRRK